MEIYDLSHDVPVFGFQVSTFPAGIGEAFESLVRKIPGGFNRSFYGLAHLGNNGQIVYSAAAEESYKGEGKKYDCESYLVEKGEYLVIAVHDWRQKTGSINQVFRDMMQDGRVDTTKPSVEWYKNDAEMWCMVRTADQK